MEIEDQISKNIKGLGQDREYTDGVYYVSELPFCLRKAYFYRKFKTRPEPNGKMVQGTIFHKALPELIKGVAGVRRPKFEMECGTVDGEIRIEGHCDIVVEGKAVWEFKFSGVRIDGPSSLPLYYKAQANMYAFLLNCPKYHIVIINRDSLEVVHFEFDTDEVAFKGMMDRAKTLHKCLHDDEFPDGPMEGWECKNRSGECMFVTVCKKEGEKKKEI